MIKIKFFSTAFSKLLFTIFIYFYYLTVVGGGVGGKNPVDNNDNGVLSNCMCTRSVGIFSFVNRARLQKESWAESARETLSRTLRVPVVRPRIEWCIYNCFFFHTAGLNNVSRTRSFIRKVFRRQQSNGVVENLYVSLVHAQQCQCDFLLETPNNGVLIRPKEIRTQTAERRRVFSPPPLSYELSVESYYPAASRPFYYFCGVTAGFQK